METRLNQEVRLLRLINSMDAKESIKVEAGDPDIVILRRWLENGIIFAKYIPGKEYHWFEYPSLQPQGRILLQQLEDELAETTSVGFMKKHRFALYRWLAALLAAMVAGAAMYWYGRE